MRHPNDALPVLAVCGSSGSGKTTLLEGLIPRLVARGLRVAAVKHGARASAVDRPGQDSDRLFRAGADVVLQSGAESVRRRHCGAAPGLSELLRSLAARTDLVVVEGHRSTSLPKIWLLANGEVEPPPDVGSVVQVLGSSDRRVDAAERIALEAMAASRARLPVLGGVLIGGESRRMGRPKQLLARGGVTLVERAVGALQGAVDRVVLLGDGDLPAGLEDLPRLPDPPGLDGPVAGLLGAMRWCPEAAWVILPCDLPMVGSDGVRWLLDQRRLGRWAVLPRRQGGRIQPLFAVYEPQSRELLERIVDRGGRAPRLIAEEAAVACPEPPATLAGQWSGINTPEELAAHDRDAAPSADDGSGPAGILDGDNDRSVG